MTKEQVKILLLVQVKITGDKMKSTGDGHNIPIGEIVKVIDTDEYEPSIRVMPKGSCKSGWICTEDCELVQNKPVVLDDVEIEIEIAAKEYAYDRHPYSQQGARIAAENFKAGVEWAKQQLQAGSTTE